MQALDISITAARGHGTAPLSRGQDGREGAAKEAGEAREEKAEKAGVKH